MTSARRGMLAEGVAGVTLQVGAIALAVRRSADAELGEDGFPAQQCMVSSSKRPVITCSRIRFRAVKVTHGSVNGRSIGVIDDAVRSSAGTGRHLGDEPVPPPGRCSQRRAAWYQAHGSMRTRAWCLRRGRRRTAAQRIGRTRTSPRR